jgi:hypothetical protein
VPVVLKMMPIPEAVALPFSAQHVDRGAGVFDPGEGQEKAAAGMLDERARWASALRPLRVDAVPARQAA